MLKIDVRIFLYFKIYELSIILVFTSYSEIPFTFIDISFINCLISSLLVVVLAIIQPPTWSPASN